MSHILFGSVLLLLAAGFAARRHHWARHHLWRRLFRKLDTTPAQERAIRDLFHSTRDRLQQIHSEGRTVRREIGDILRGEQFDPARFSAAEAQVDEKFRDARAVIRESLGQMHEILDARQRATLADWITSGPHCYRCSHC